jgi:hypothetical protein
MSQDHGQDVGGKRKRRQKTVSSRKRANGRHHKRAYSDYSSDDRESSVGESEDHDAVFSDSD